VKHLFAAILFVATVAVFSAACGDDEDSPGSDNPGGPAAGVAGVWEGTYGSNTSDRAGAFCLELEQNGRDLAGNISFDGTNSVPVGGLIANNDLSLAWGAAAEATVDSDSISRGGNFTGAVDEGAASGSWVGTLGDIGDWTAERTDAESCG